MMVKKIAQVFNGITVAYFMSGIQTMYALLAAFGIQLSAQKETAISAFVSWAITLGIHLGHRLGEAQAEAHAIQPDSGA